jgi:hypothetical protein
MLCPCLACYHNGLSLFPFLRLYLGYHLAFGNPLALATAFDVPILEVKGNFPEKLLFIEILNHYMVFFVGLVYHIPCRL